MTVAEKMVESGLCSYPANARVAILEKRVTLNNRVVTHQETPWPTKPGVYHIAIYEKGQITSEEFIHQ